MSLRRMISNLSSEWFVPEGNYLDSSHLLNGEQVQTTLALNRREQLNMLNQAGF